MRRKHWKLIGTAFVLVMVTVGTALGLLVALSRLQQLPTEADRRVYFREHREALDCLRSGAAAVTEQERKLTTGLEPLVERCRADGVIAVYPGGPGYWRVLIYSNRLSALDDGTVGGFVFGEGIPADKIVSSLDEVRRRPEREVMGFVELEDGWFLFEQRW